jgi:hypothetical protein
MLIPYSGPYHGMHYKRRKRSKQQLNLARLNTLLESMYDQSQSCCAYWEERLRWPHQTTFRTILDNMVTNLISNQVSGIGGAEGTLKY